MRRFGRKRDIEAMTTSLPLSVAFFDCLMIDGQSLIDQPTSERHQAMSAAIHADLRIPRLVTGKREEANQFLDQALESGHEGIMAKSTEAAYVAGGRGQS
jgi:DNA ligase-1